MKNKHGYSVSGYNHQFASLAGFSKSLSNMHIIVHRGFSTTVKWFFLRHNNISVLRRDFQQITNNCQTQSSLRRVENHADEIKNYDD